MGIFDRAKEAYKQNQEKRATTLVNVEYMGGYKDKKKAVGNLSFYEKQTEFRVALRAKSSFTIPNTDIVDIAIEGKDEVSRRITATRLVAVGIFAVALPKKSKNKDAFVTIVLTDDQEAVFQVNKKSPMEVKAKLSQAVAQVRQGAPKPASTVAPASVADELAKLAKLKEDSIITQAEFDKKKAELLA
jgi:hypothetical protein